MPDYDVFAVLCAGMSFFLSKVGVLALRYLEFESWDPGVNFDNLTVEPFHRFLVLYRPFSRIHEPLSDSPDLFRPGASGLGQHGSCLLGNEIQLLLYAIF